MEAELGCQKQTQEKEESANGNAGHVQVTTKENNVVVVEAQLVEPSKEDPHHCPSLLVENLSRQFLEYEEMAAFLSPEEQERRLLACLSLFLKAWEQSNGKICFPYIQLLACEASKLLVQKIKKKMNGKPAEEAQRIVWQFLQQKAEEATDGGVLLRSVYLLSLGDLEEGIQGTIIKSGLPVTLLQCLYLFFAFPSEEGAGNRAMSEGEQQAQEMFVQTMLNIYAEQQGVEELLGATDLQSLITATASLWDQGSPLWKGPTSHVLRTISKAQSQNTISYLQATNCIKISIQNLSKLADSMPPRDICEAINIILAFVKNSYSISPALLSEFESSGGYQLLQKVFLRYDGLLNSKEDASFKETLDFLTQLTICGKTELKVSVNTTYPQLSQFNAKQPFSSGNRVKNLKAFQVLESLFRKSSNPELCQCILQAIKSIWTWDSMNFFLLEWSLQPISQFVGIIPLKPPSVQAQFFQLLESVVLDLSYIPHEILKEVQSLIKENAEPLCTSLALRSLHRITQSDQLFTDIFRDSGLLGTLLAQLRKEAKILRKKGRTQAAVQDQTIAKELISMTLKMVAALVVGSARNTVVLRDYGMVPFIKIFVDDDLYRSDTLTILEQLSVINPEEYMSFIVGALCSSTQGELNLKLDLLKSLLRSLGNPKGRSAFRTSSGFNGLLSLLSDMEGILQDPPSGSWASFDHCRAMELILCMLQVIATALHLDPVNSDFFQKQALFGKMAEDLGLLGCFSAQKSQQTPVQLNKTRSFAEFSKAAVCSSEDFPTWLKSCIMILTFFDHMAKGTSVQFQSSLMDTNTGVNGLSVFIQKTKENQQDETEDGCEKVDNNKTASGLWPESKNKSDGEDWSIVCPGALCVMVKLLPKLYNEAYPELSWEIQYAVADHIQFLMRLEKTRQVACAAGLLDAVVTSCLDALHNTSHPLHLPLIRLFEKLASQSIEPAVLRQFLCHRKSLLVAPVSSVSPPTDPASHRRGLCRTASDEGSEANTPNNSADLHPAPLGSDTSQISESSAMALQAAMSLISMTTPRSLEPQNICLAPSFVEFDMSLEGYGCLFLPTLATVLGPKAEYSISGGIGKGPRLFPPVGGLTFSSWFLVSRMGSTHSAHPLRFLTLVRHMARTEEEFTCLAVSFSPMDGCLTISTEEMALQALDIMEPEPEDVGQSSVLSQVQFNCANVLVTRQWHHLAVIVAKETKRICTVTAYINGQLVGSAKMQYIQPLPGGFVSMDPSSFVDVYGYVATPLIWKQKSSLTWRQGPMYLFEDVISVDTLQLIVKLGPRYCGNFQAVELRGGDFGTNVQTAALVAPEKIAFGISAMSSSYTTVKDIKDCYGEVDGRLIAKELALSSRDSTTPVFMARNTAGKLSGPLRTIGSVIVGQYGTRVFQCCPAATALNYIGGPAILLNLLDVAHDDHAMYAAVKVLHSVLNSSAMSEKLMREIGGYQILAYLLKRKTHLLNHRILQLIFSIGGTVETNTESLNIKSLEAFQHIICNFEVWCHAPENLDLSLFAQLTEILQSRNGSWNAKLALWGQMVPKLFLLFSDPEVTCSRVSRICTVLSHVLWCHFSIKDILWIGLFLVYTLSPCSVDESQTCLYNVPESQENVLRQMSGKMIWLRNQLFRVLLDVMHSDKLHLSSEMQEVVFQALGPDWFLMFTQGHVHPSTVLLAIKLLLHFLHNRILLRKFKEGMMAGLWLENNSVGLNLLMDNLKSHARILEYSPYLLSGFEELKIFLHNHTHIPEIYFLLSGLFLATPVSEPPVEAKADLDSMLQWLLQIHRKDAVAIVGLCPEAAVLLLEMVKSMVKRTPVGTDVSWEITYPGHIMQFFCLIYHRYPQDPLWCNSDFLQALALVVFPSVIPQDSCESSLDPDSLAAASCSDPDLPASVPLHHPKKQVWDFIRLLLMETLLLVSAQKQWHPLELLLEASAESSTTEQKRYFQTEILLSIMDIFHIIGKREGETCSLTGNNYARSVSEPSLPLVLTNISYFTQKLVEKLYAGMFLADPRKIILFFVEQLIQVMEKVSPQKEPVVSILYSGLNRTILYCLSSPVSDPQRRLNIFHILQQQWDIIFATHNSSSAFTTCFLYCLTQLMPTSSEHEATLRPSSDHLAPNKEEEVIDDSSAPKNVQEEIWKATAGIWNQLLSQRRKDLEDVYKMPLFAERGDGGESMKMASITPLWEETMAKTWQQFLGSEKKAPQNKVPTQALSKMSSWSGSLSSAIKLAQSRNIKPVGCKTKDFVSCLEKYRRSGQELYAVLYKDHVQRLQHVYNKAAKAWTNIKEQVLGRGGLWGSALAPSASRWVLDGFEGPARMRKRIRFSITHQTSMTVGNKAQQTHENPSAPNLEESQEQLMINGEEKGMDCGQLTFFPALRESIGSDDLLDMCVERKIILQEFTDDEKITCRKSVVIVQGHIAMEGVLLFGQDHFYICKYFTLSHLEEVYCTRHCLSSISDSFIYSLCDKDHAMGQPTCSCYSYNDIKEFHRMRFLLQEIALEIFFKSGYSVFLVFHNGDRKKAMKRFCSMKPVLKSKGITEESINIRSTAGGEKSMLLKWQRGEISNFDYLMYLNTQAGRTYNDLMQYPVFPWVLADYHSQTLDLTNPSVFRDLSKPMGAQTAERKAKFIQRYKEVEKSEGNLSAQCHYCTHYSSAIIVASYLVRIEPFTQIFCSLQGGGFDVADRMFHSMKSTWDSVSRDNMTDVRELTPEFYYLPEFLTNCNHFEFGKLQDGTLLDDVQLPPWAEGNPHRFISLHRQALESNYVSAHLHHWIDLIFGHKQHGPAAANAVNVFHPYFYGDQVNLDSISDPLIKSTILGFVSNFGQIPKQLFTKPHPARNALGKHSMGRESMLFAYPAGQLPPSLSSLHNLKFSSVTVKEALQGPVGHIVCNEKGILAVGKNKILLPPLWNRVFCWGFDDFTCCLTGYGSDKQSMATFETTADWGDCLCAVCPTPTTLITSGSSSVMCFWELSTTKDGSTCLKLKKPLYGHTQPVTCLAASTSYSLVVSGSADRSCIIWDLNQLTHITQLPAHEACLSAVAINDSTGDIASCAGVALHLWNINGESLARLSPSVSIGATISCCCFIEVMDWDIHSLIVAGDTSGSVQNLPLVLELDQEATLCGGKEADSVGETSVTQE
ncbi:hypothetical protein lerEdw1_013228 [Lerista edwardsae]|nr:hypothetical protein lerEdw1_013228 [Lerista edwardsae]